MKLKKYINCVELRLLLLFPSLLALSSCEKFIEVDAPPTSVNSSNIYNNDATAASVMTGIYSQLSGSDIKFGSSLTSISYLAGLSADELTLYKGSTNKQFGAYYTNSLGVLGGFEIWNSAYANIYVINSAIEGISDSKTLTPAVKQQLLGEAKFMRAFYFFYLTNLYGGIPLTMTTDFKANSLLSRSSNEEVMAQVISDLNDAQTLLSENYLDASLLQRTDEKVRPTKWAAISLLARAYLYIKDWKNAEQASNAIINGPFQLAGLNDVFKKNNSEAIWQLQPVNIGANTPEAVAFIINSAADLSNKPAYLNVRLVESFEEGDQRKNNWISKISIAGDDYFYSYKYKIPASSDPNALLLEYSTIFRLAEQYLIRAEAKIQQDQLSDGIKDLNRLRLRATDENAAPDLQLKQLPFDLSKEDALMALFKERQYELFTEWGHRWLDLKRSQKIDEVMTEEVPRKVLNGTWNEYQKLYPLPVRDLEKNLNLGQNPGY